MAEESRKILVGEAEEEEQAEEKEVDVDLTQVFEWNSEEFEYYEKGKNWKWSLVAISAVFFLIFLLSGNWTASLLTIVGALVLYQFAFKKPRVLHYIISRDGVTVGEQELGFEEFVSYWISDDGWLYFNRRWRPRLTIKVESVDMEQLDLFMSVFLEKVARNDRDSGDRWSSVLKL